VQAYGSLNSNSLASITTPENPRLLVVETFDFAGNPSATSKKVLNEIGRIGI